MGYKIKVGFITDLPWIREFRRRKERKEANKIVLKELEEHLWETL